MLRVAFEDDWGNRKYTNVRYYNQEKDKFYQVCDLFVGATVLYSFDESYQAFLQGAPVSLEQRPAILERIRKHGLKKNLSDCDIELNIMIPIRCVAYCYNQDIKTNGELLTPDIYSGPFNQDLATARKHNVTKGKFDLVKDAFESCCTKCDTFELYLIMAKANRHDETYLRFIHEGKNIDCVVQRDTGIEEKACECD